MKDKFYRWLVKRDLLKKYGGRLRAVNLILEEYLTKKILEGGSQEYLSKGRQELVNKQAEIKENERFVEFLKKLK